MTRLFPEMKFVSPVSGVVREIVRGEKRVLTEVVIEQAGSDKIDFGAADPLKLTREEVRTKLLGSGLWPVTKAAAVSHRCPAGRCSKGDIHLSL
ncbi:MAG: hypothetical protein MZV63_38970 [Marinilabiliales bacterium]|nr:hypothetical protein [Marinilabiliales bacterium]